MVYMYIVSRIQISIYITIIYCSLYVCIYMWKDEQENPPSFLVRITKSGGTRIGGSGLHHGPISIKHESGLREAAWSPSLLVTQYSSVRNIKWGWHGYREVLPSLRATKYDCTSLYRCYPINGSTPQGVTVKPPSGIQKLYLNILLILLQGYSLPAIHSYFWIIRGSSPETHPLVFDLSLQVKGSLRAIVTGHISCIFVLTVDAWSICIPSFSFFYTYTYIFFFHNFFL